MFSLHVPTRATFATIIRLLLCNLGAEGLSYDKATYTIDESLVHWDTFLFHVPIV